MKKQSSLAMTLFFIWMGHFMVDFMIGTWAIYKTLAGLDLAIAGIISGVAAFIGEGMQIVFGPLSDKGHRKKLILGGILFTCAGALLAYFTNYWILGSLFLIVCIGSGAFHPSAVSLIGSLTQKRKALFITLFASGGSLGLAASQLIFAKAYLTLDGQTIFLILPSLVLIMAVFYFGLAGQETQSTSKKIEFKTLFSFFKRRDLRLLYIAQVCSQALLWGTIFLLPDVLLCRQYDSWVCLGGGHLFFVLGAAMMVVPSGYLADKYSPRLVVGGTLSLAMICFYIFLFNPHLSPVLLVVLVFLLGSFLGVANPIIVAMGNRLVPDKPGMVSAFLLGLAWCVAEGLGQAGGGLLTKFFVDDAPAKALSILGVLFIVGITAIYKSSETDILEPSLVPAVEVNPVYPESVS